MVELKKRVILPEMLNSDMCKKCGGSCCKHNPCKYYPSDFGKMKEDMVIELINTRRAIIDIAQADTITGRNLYLILRARGIYDFGDIFWLDDLHDNNPCIYLQRDGCEFDINNRPGEGLYLTPCAFGDCDIPKKYDNLSRKWYTNLYNQSVLHGIIKRFDIEEVLEDYYDQLILPRELNKSRHK